MNKFEFSVVFTVDLSAGLAVVNLLVELTLLVGFALLLALVVSLVERVIEFVKEVELLDVEEKSVLFGESVDNRACSVLSVVCCDVICVVGYVDDELIAVVCFAELAVLIIVCCDVICVVGYVDEEDITVLCIANELLVVDCTLTVVVGSHSPDPSRQYRSEQASSAGRQ